jgi:hypothetical protein
MGIALVTGASAGSERSMLTGWRAAAMTSFSWHATDSLRELGVPAHLISHLKAMAKLHVQGRYDRMTDDLVRLTGKAPTSVYDFVQSHAAEFNRGEAAAA